MAVLRDTQTPLSDHWLTPSDQPRLISVDVQGGRLGLIVFPDQDQPAPDQEQAVINLAHEARSRGEHNLIIGISTWGAGREERFIAAMDPVFDIVFGTGEGPGYTGLYLRDNKVLWVRAFTKGRNLLSVTIPELPDPGSKITWTPEATVKTQALSLGNAVPSSPRIEAIFPP